MALCLFRTDSMRPCQYMLEVNIERESLSATAVCPLLVEPEGQAEGSKFPLPDGPCFSVSTAVFGACRQGSLPEM